ncbi:hypothetical protein MSPP1_001689 [Malassezia sp. CBS 17886]|nr:hypothetical protein MSPP1_001689 [Malassezia sp. CBS 17886]
MGNGARAQQKRERNAKAGAGGAAKSQLKVNEAAKSIICQTCRQTFLITVREPALKQHAENKHGKEIKDCFPSWSAA